MIGVLGVVVFVGVIALCVGPLYNCKKSTKKDFDDEEEQESPTVRIKISHPDPEENRIDSEDENKIVWRPFRSVPSDDTKFVPIKPPRNRKLLGQASSGSDRASTSIWSPALRSQLESISNSEACEEPHQVVKAQVEVHPTVSADQGTPDSLRRGWLRGVSSSILTPKETYPDNEKAKRLSLVLRKWKSLKRTLRYSKSKKCALAQNSSYDETQRLNIPAVCRGSPMGHSTMVQKQKQRQRQRQRHRAVEASSGTSLDILESKGSSSNVDLLSTEYGQPTTNAVSLMKRRSVNGKSICDVRITGLSQTELLDLYEATGGKAASIVTTEKESIISIKLNRACSENERRTREDTRENSSYYECPLTRFYKTSIEKFEDISIFLAEIIYK